MIWFAGGAGCRSDSLYNLYGIIMPPSVGRGMLVCTVTGLLRLESSKVHLPWMWRIAKACLSFIHRKPVHFWADARPSIFCGCDPVSSDAGHLPTSVSCMFWDFTRLPISTSGIMVETNYIQMLAVISTSQSKILQELNTQLTKLFLPGSCPISQTQNLREHRGLVLFLSSQLDQITLHMFMSKNYHLLTGMLVLLKLCTAMTLGQIPSSKRPQSNTANL